MVFTSHVATSSAFNRTGDRAHSVEGPDAENSVDSSGMIIESLVLPRRDGVSRSLVSRLANVFGGISPRASTDDESRPRNETNAGAGIKFNMHDDDDITVARAATYADGSAFSSVWEQSVFNTVASTSWGTKHRIDGDTLFICVNIIIIFVRGTTVVNVCANALIKLIITTTGSSLNRPGVVINRSTKFSTSDDIDSLNVSGDFSVSNSFADTDVGITHGRDRLTVENTRRKRTHVLAGKTAFDDIEVNKLMTTDDCIALKVDGITDNTSNKFVSVTPVSSFNKPGHPDSIVVNLIKCWGLKVHSNSKESNEFIIPRIDLGDNEQRMDGDVEYIL